MSNKLFYPICLALVLALTGFAQAELLVNPGFEAGFDSWKTWGGGSGSGAGGWFYNYTAHATVMEDGTAHGGDKYVEVGIEDLADSWWAVSLVFQEHPVTEGNTYQSSAWFRNGDADGVPSLIANGGQVQWEWRDAAPVGDPNTDDRGALIDGGRIGHNFDLTEEWTYVSATEVAPPGAKGVTVIYGTTWGGINLDVDDTSFGLPPVTIPVDPNSDLAAANALANPGDTILFAEGTYDITSQIEIKDGVTYQGAGAGLTIIDGNDATRAFAAWGDRGATNGQVDANGVGIPNLTGPTDWVLDGLTIQNCVSDANNRQDILSAARDLLNNYVADTPYTLETASAENGAIADNPEAFEALSGGADDVLTDVELQAYLDDNPPGSAGHYVVNDDKKDDGGAVCILNGADGTIRNCAFSNNSAVDDGGAIMVDGQDLDVTIENCAFNLNTCGDQAGAVKLSGAASNSTVIGCSFTENSAPEDDAGAIQMDGAGSTGSVYTLMDCTFTGCSAFDDGGAIFANADNSTYVWTDCTFIGNYVTDSGADGGAVRYSPDRADMTVTNCSFIGNGKDPNGTPVGDDGGAWKTDDDDCGPMTFMNCLFADNASKDDRILEVKGGSAILNCTFIGNVAGDEALIAVRGQAWDSTGDENDDVTTDDSIISNCLFINNTLLSNKQIIGDTRNDVFAPTVTNCLFFGNLDQNEETAENTDDNSVEVGTIDVSAVTDAAQLVVDPAGDYHLAAGSPAIDASDPATATDADIEGTAAVGVRDIGAYESVAVVVGDKYVLDDFEQYTEVYPIWNAWADGYFEDDNGSVVGTEFPPGTEQGAMPLFYDNTGTAVYSEVTRTYDPPQNWSQLGFNRIVISFKGVPENTLGQLYIRINDNDEVPYEGSDADLQDGIWHTFNAGFNLTSVQTLTIGVKSGGKGMFYIDNIELGNL